VTHFDLDCDVSSPCKTKCRPNCPSNCQAQVKGIRGGAAGPRVLDLACLAFLRIRLASSSLPENFPPATNGCLTLRARAAESSEDWGVRRPSRSCQRCKVSISLVSPSQSLSWSKVWTFFCAFSFIFFMLIIIKLLELVQSMRSYRGFLVGRFCPFLVVCAWEIQVALFFWSVPDLFLDSFESFTLLDLDLPVCAALFKGLDFRNC